MIKEDVQEIFLFWKYNFEWLVIFFYLFLLILHYQFCSHTLKFLLSFFSFLAALSSSRNLVVGLSVGRLVGRSVSLIMSVAPSLQGWLIDDWLMTDWYLMGWPYHSIDCVLFYLMVFKQFTQIRNTNAGIFFGGIGDRGREGYYRILRFVNYLCYAGI